jgi:streptogramin lyase
VALNGTGAAEPNSCTTNATTSPAQPAPTASYAGSSLGGKVMAGGTPLIGSSVQLYAAGSSGNGSAPTTLLGTPLLTDANGAFTVPSGYSCPYSNSVLYAVARGGQAGPNGAANNGTALASVLGTCDSITADPAFTINELTTAATAWSMAPFLSAGGRIGATATNSSGIALAAGTFANLVNPLTGSAPGTYFPSTGQAPTATLDSAANLLNACIASTGATSSSCTQLYSLTASSTLKPVNTLDAAMNVVQHPANNTAALYTLSTSSTAYTPALTQAPSDWTLFVTYDDGGLSDPSAVSIDSTGRIWVADYYYAASLFSNTGTPIFTGGINGNALYNSYGGAVDVNDVEWITNEQGPDNINALGTVTLLDSSGSSPAIYGSGGLNFPHAIAMDTSGNAWVADYGSSSVTIFNSTGQPLSGPAGYTNAQYAFPVAIATDSKCNGFIANQGTDTVSFTSADGSIYGTYVTGDGPSGLAIDSNDNVWVADYYGDNVGLISSAGNLLSGTSGFTGGGIDHPNGIAVDGQGNAWIANYRTAGLSEISGLSGTSAPAVVSHTQGWGHDAGLLETYGIAIDAGGSIWVTNSVSNTLTQFVGLAAPVKTPLLGPVRIP